MAINNLYSCFTITAAPSEQNEWSLFSSGAGWPIAGDQRLIQTRAHTNIPRGGDTGLPMGWEALIRTWRASLNTRFVDGPVLDWAQATSAELFFNEKPYATASLLDLLAAPQAVFDDVPSREFFAARAGRDQPAFQPMWIRENIRYGVTVTSPQRAVDGVKKWLAEHTVDGRILCWVHLDGVVLSRLSQGA
jgi:hypothetical protein